MSEIKTEYTTTESSATPKGHRILRHTWAHGGVNFTIQGQYIAGGKRRWVSKSGVMIMSGTFRDEAVRVITTWLALYDDEDITSLAIKMFDEFFKTFEELLESESPPNTPQALN